MADKKINKVSADYEKGKKFQTSSRRNRQIATKRKGKEG